MRKDECEFSSFIMHPGTGRRYVPFAFLSTKPVLPFARPKCMALYLRKKNPRTVPWTRTFRRLHKKTSAETTARRRSHKSSKVARAIVGGLLFSTVVSLVFLPTIYLWLDVMSRWPGRAWRFMVRSAARLVHWRPRRLRLRAN